MVRFDDEDLQGATFRETDLRDARTRGVRLLGADIDGQLDGQLDGQIVNGVKVMPPTVRPENEIANCPVAVDHRPPRSCSR